MKHQRMFTTFLSDMHMIFSLAQNAKSLELLTRFFKKGVY